METATILKLAGVYIVFTLTTFGFIQREKIGEENQSGSGVGKSAFWALLWPVYWLVVVGPKSSLNNVAKFFSHNIGFWALYLLGVPASFAVFVYVRWSDEMLFGQGIWILFKALCMALVWPVFLFV
jgi:hypothetical protein